MTAEWANEYSARNSFQLIIIEINTLFGDLIWFLCQPKIITANVYNLLRIKHLFQRNLENGFRNKSTPSINKNKKHARTSWLWRQQ